LTRSARGIKRMTEQSQRRTLSLIKKRPAKAEPVNKDEYARILIMARSSLQNTGRIHFRRLLYINFDSACSQATDRTIFESTSFQLPLSSVSSATKRFSRLFSSCRCLNCRLLKLPHLVCLQPLVLLLPAIQRLLGDPNLADQLRDRHPHLSLLQHGYDLLHGK